jgi:hypothetical protein
MVFLRPLIDFSISPYVALFFAFNGVRPSQAHSKDYSAVYALIYLNLPVYGLVVEPRKTRMERLRTALNLQIYTIPSNSTTVKLSKTNTQLMFWITLSFLRLGIEE